MMKTVQHYFPLRSSPDHGLLAVQCLFFCPYNFNSWFVDIVLHSFNLNTVCNKVHVSNTLPKCSVLGQIAWNLRKKLRSLSFYPWRQFMFFPFCSLYSVKSVNWQNSTKWSDCVECWINSTAHDISACIRLWIYEHLNVWLCQCMDIWVWMYELMSLWMLREAQWNRKGRHWEKSRRSSPW